MTAGISFFGIPATISREMQFSRAVSESTIPYPESSNAETSELRSIVPSSGTKIPAIRRNSVVFPAPLGPRMPTR